MLDLKRLLPRILVACVASALLASLIDAAFFKRFLPDYTVFWAAARMVQVNPSLVYNDAALTIYQSHYFEMWNGWRPFAYPPSVLPLLIPFSWLPALTSYALFTSLSLGAYAYAARRLVGWNWALLLALISSPVYFAARSGQMSLLIGALVIGGLLLFPKREFTAGILIGVAAALKPQLLVLAPLALIAARKWDALAGALAGGQAFVLSSFFTWPSLWVDWLRSLPRFLETVTALNLWRGGVTPSSIMWNLGLNGPPQVAVQIVCAGIACLAVWNVFRYSDDPAVQLVALIGGALLCAPYAMNYELAILAPVAAMWLLKKDTPLWPMVFSGLLLFADGATTPPVAMLFLFFALKDHVRLPSLKPAQA